MTVDVDVVVIGLGVLGASALRELARDGRRVLGIEQFAPGHRNGSSHGRSRAVRFLYHAPEYVQLLRPAIDGWRALEAESGRPIYWPCGTLFFARPENPTFRQNVAIMAAGGLAHEMLDAVEVRRRFPAFELTDGATAVFNADGGFVDADAAVGAFIAGAVAAGAEIRTDSRAVAVDLDADPVRVRLADGAVVSAGHVVIAAGAWTNDLVPDLRLPIRVTQQAWFTMRPQNTGASAVDPAHMPVWCDYDTMYYGFPDHGPGLKIADDTPGREVDPHASERRTDDGTEQRTLTAYLRDRFPSAGLTLQDVGSCLYTLTPDEDFLLGLVPGSGGRASVALGLNHAFKFAPVIGRILADLGTTGRTAQPVERFRIDRFAPAAAG